MLEFFFSKFVVVIQPADFLPVSVVLGAAVLRSTRNKSIQQRFDLAQCRRELSPCCTRLAHFPLTPLLPVIHPPRSGSPCLPGRGRGLLVARLSLTECCSLGHCYFKKNIASSSCLSCLLFREKTSAAPSTPCGYCATHVHIAGGGTGLPPTPSPPVFAAAPVLLLPYPALSRLARASTDTLMPLRGSPQAPAERSLSLALG